MDKIKNKINNLYSNGYFKLVFFALVIILILYKYTSISDRISSLPDIRIKNDENAEPQKVNTIKKLQVLPSVVYEEALQKKEEKAERLKKEEEARKAREEAMLELEKQAEEYKKEFSKNKPNPKARMVKYGDTVDFKMLITNGDNFAQTVRPVELSIKITREKDNKFAKFLVGKRRGQVVIIPFQEFVDRKLLEETMAQVGNNSPEEIEAAINQVINSNMLYRIKILNIKTK